VLSLQIAYVLGLICIIWGISATFFLVGNLVGGQIDRATFADRLLVVATLMLLSMMCITGMSFVSIFAGG